MKNGIYRINKPSNRDRERYIASLQQQLGTLKGALIHIIKDRGSNIVPGRFTLITSKDLKDAAVKPDDDLIIETKDREVWFIVEQKKEKEFRGEG